MALELLSLSKFKLRLLAITSEARDLRERERSAGEQLHLSIQREKQLEKEYAKMLQESQTELASRDESLRRVETKVKYLENENVLLEKKEKELRETINSLLQSRDTFLHIYEDSAWSLKRTIQMKDRKLAVLSEKIHAHLLLFDSIEKEASAIKQVVEYIQHIVNERELVATEVKGKMDRISTVEKDFAGGSLRTELVDSKVLYWLVTEVAPGTVSADLEIKISHNRNYLNRWHHVDSRHKAKKICFLKKKLGDHQIELQKRDNMILELKENLEAEKIKNNFQPQIEELRKALLVKDEVIQRLTSEKQALQLELQKMEVMLQRIQDIAIKTSAKDRKVLSSVLESREISETISGVEDGSFEKIIQESGQEPSNNYVIRVATNNTAMSLSKEQKLVDGSLEKAVNSSLPKHSVTTYLKPEGSDTLTSDVLVTKDGNVVPGTLLAQHIG